MAKRRAERPTFLFNKGLNTDAPILVFPQDFTTDEVNFELMLDGTRRKRRGLEAEGAHSEIDIPISEGFVVRTFKWRSVNTNLDLNFHVWQIGYTLVFADDVPYPTDNLRGFTVDLRDFAVEGHNTDNEIGQNYVDMAFGRGHAIVVGKYIEPTLLVYSEEDDEIQPQRISIRERDFQGIEDGIDNTTRPATLSDTYAYNLVNQGWVYGDILTFHASKGNYPSKNMIPWLGFRREVIEGFNPDDGTKVFSPDKLVAELFQDAPSPKGHFIQNPFDTTVNVVVDTETIKNYVGGGWAPGTDDGFLPDSPNALNLPSESNPNTQSLVTITFQNPHFLSPGEQFELYTENLGKIGSLTGDGNRLWGIGGGLNNQDPSFNVESVIDDRTVTFYMTMQNDHAGWRNTWPHSYWPNVYSFAGGTVLNIEGRIIDERPTATAFFAGRAWYGGIPNSTLGSALFFSQVVEVDAQYGKCYQVADPTDENISDLVPTDGGVLRIPEMGRVLRLLPYSDSLLVFGSNGVWQIGPGQAGYFGANSYSVRKLTDVGCESARSVVLAEEVPCYWGRSGIFCIIQDTNSGFLVAQSLTKDKIDNFYKAIKEADRREASGDWDEINKRVVWTYSQENEDLEREYKALYFDVKFQAFTPHKFGVTVHDIFTTTDSLHSEVSALRYIVTTDYGATEIATATSLEFQDFGTSPYEAYMVTGYDTAQSPTRYKYAPVITSFMKRPGSPPVEPSFFLTSRPYAIENVEALNSYAVPTGGDHYGITIEALDVSFGILNGTFGTFVTSTDGPTEALDISFTFNAGSLGGVGFEEYEIEPEAIDVSASFDAGEIFTAVITYVNWPAEALDISFTFDSGSLS
jgi:hypothetical protein